MIRAADHVPAPTLPNGWFVQRLGDLVDLVNGHPFSSDDFAPDGDIPLVRIRDLTADEFEVYVPRGAVPRRAVLEPGDVVIGMDGDFNVVVWERGPAALNQRLCKLRPREGTDHRFIAYALPALLKVVNDLTFSTTVKHLSSSDILGQRLPAPSIDEQRRIADFLDTETARIDQLVTARKQQQPLLEERWRAEIRNELEGRGEGRTPSHVPWLARHPASWRPIRLRHLAHIQRGASPRPINDPIYFDDAGTHAWVRISDVSASGKFLRRTDQTLSSLGRSRSVALKPGELFVSIAASVGKPVIAAIDCCIHDGFVAIRRPRASVDFLYYVLQLGDCFEGLGKLGTQLNLNSDTIGSVMVALPPQREQVEIAHRLDLTRESLRRVSVSIERQVGILQERRQALITAAVTGQFDVTTARGIDTR